MGVRCCFVLSVNNTATSKNFRNLFIVLSHLLEKVPRDLGASKSVRGSMSDEKNRQIRPSAAGARQRERERRAQAHAAAVATAGFTVKIDGMSPPTPRSAAAAAAASAAAADSPVDRVSLNPAGTGISEWLLNLMFLCRHFIGYIVAHCNYEQRLALFDLLVVDPQENGDAPPPQTSASTATTATASVADLTEPRSDGSVDVVLSSQPLATDLNPANGGGGSGVASNIASNQRSQRIAPQLSEVSLGTIQHHITSPTTPFTVVSSRQLIVWTVCVGCVL